MGGAEGGAGAFVERPRLWPWRVMGPQWQLGARRGRQKGEALARKGEEEEEEEGEAAAEEEEAVEEEEEVGEEEGRVGPKVLVSAVTRAGAAFPVAPSAP